ncbi:MAG: AAA family ATPase [Scytonematopsis contorta HA4267-MV1]|jgi:predicted ATPase/signal transduction histidine kinase|nr:AAA family ATPase [Scytonematopsis contorta HA4267-MV1]
MNNITINIPGFRILTQIYTGTRTLVYRGLRESDQQPVVLKLMQNQYPNFKEIVQFCNQYTIVKNINSLGVVKPYSLQPYGNGYFIVMEDFGGISLSEYIKQHFGKGKLPISDFLEIAISIVTSLEEIHLSRIIHKDIKPDNILINPETKQVKLIDFSISSLLPREMQQLHNPNVLEGTLAYISPEQTGRMNRGIDYRSDFYSLGVTFFELLTGRLAFSSDDPMELVHSHITKLPPSVNAINSNIPLVLSEIIHKLMAKNAEDRYVGTRGLKHDLSNCWQNLKETGNIPLFALGERDITDRFIIPEKLYGREDEVKELIQAFERVATGAGEMALVSGFSGIGKTVVVNEVHKPIVRQRGYFIKGKYDQYQRNIPFSAFVQAFQDLIRQLLGESDAQLAEWKKKILLALNENAKVIIEVIPELEKIIGKQPTVAELEGTAAQNRFNLLFQKFIQVFTTDKHPLVIFLDDLQWADLASLKLMQLLMSENHGYLLLIGAYRDNEVNPIHPLVMTLEEIQKNGVTINQINLPPIKQYDLNNLVADTLNCSSIIAQRLTELIYQKTQGNPFFSNQFLKALYDDGLINFNFNTGYWQCDIASVITLSLTDDVVEFVALQIQKLPKEAQAALKMAACIGNQFDLATLAIVCEISQAETAANLWKALQFGLIIPTNEVYKFYQNYNVEDDSKISVNSEFNITQSPIYRFLHDRIQQAAYSLIPESEKKITHLKIGELLLKNTPKVEQEKNIFDIVQQLNYGVDLIIQQNQKDELAELNLIAGKKAKAATAYAAAVEYFNTGIKLLAQESWSCSYNLTLALHIELMEAEYLNTNIEGSETLAEVILNKANNQLDVIKVYETKIQIYMNTMQSPKAIDIGLEALEVMGLSLANILDYAGIEVILPQLSDVDNLRVMTDPKQLAILRILTAITSAVLNSRPEILFPIILTQVHICIQHGYSTSSAFSYVWYGTILCINPKTIEKGFHSGRLAIKFLEKFNANHLKASVYNMFYVFINPWKNSLRESLVPLVEVIQSGLEAGDLVYASYGAENYTFYSLASGENLKLVEQKQTYYIDFCREMKNEFVASDISTVKQLNLNLQGKAVDKYRLVGESFNETIMLPQLQAAKMGYLLFNVYQTKGILLYLFNDYAEAVANTALAAENSVSLGAFIPVAINNFYYSLALLAQYPHVDAMEQQQNITQVEINQELLKQWAFHAPSNFQHKYELVEAERYRLLGKKSEAIELYDSAIALAKQNQYIQEEALANELAAKFYLEWGKEKLAQSYMIEAYYCYSRWGALAKAEGLEILYPQLLYPILKREKNNVDNNATISLLNKKSATSTSSTASTLLDIFTVTKASQALSREIKLDKLLSILMEVVIENSGATKGILLLLQNGQLFVEATSVAGNNNHQILQFIPLLEYEDIPHTVINYVKNSYHNLVINNIATEINFANDAYIIKYQPQSVLCIPILKQGNLIGILYLENQVISGAFTSERLEFIYLLISQAAISIENARLYQQAQEYAQAKKDYAQQLESSLQELTEAQLQLIQSEKMSALGNLVAGIAHEINNPVGFIGGNLEPALNYVKDLFNIVDLYQQEYPKPNPIIDEEIEAIDLEYLRQDLPKLITSMKEGVQRIRNISNSLRTFSRADTDNKIYYNIHEGLDSTIMILKHRLKANETRPEIEITRNYGDLPLIQCYPGQLNQVFMNLLANAIDALEESNTGRSFTEIQANPNRITITTKMSDNKKQLLISIKDNGLGMTQDVKDRIFDHLFTTKAVGKGTGLGLAIAHQIIVEKHSGTLNVNSEPAYGAEFLIEIPAEQ